MGERFLVTGGNRLSGEVAVGGAKNSVLKLMAAALFAEGTTTITNCPDILDVPLMAEVLRGLGPTSNWTARWCGSPRRKSPSMRPTSPRCGSSGLRSVCSVRW